MEDYDILAIM